ncbi:MAG: hypothetical protein AUK20_00290 [Parcubacteria group bacterium CG2_30_45_37]|nr:MAG: hypothetical protein AUK20_00290 [Parcubacteria group bacterium CG2_30_45_37]
MRNWLFTTIHHFSPIYYNYTPLNAICQCSAATKIIAKLKLKIIKKRPPVPGRVFLIIFLIIS